MHGARSAQFVMDLLSLSPFPTQYIYCPSLVGLGPQADLSLSVPEIYSSRAFPSFLESVHWTWVLRTVSVLSVCLPACRSFDHKP